MAANFNISFFELLRSGEFEMFLTKSSLLCRKSSIEVSVTVEDRQPHSLFKSLFIYSFISQKYCRRAPGREAIGARRNFCMWKGWNLCRPISKCLFDYHLCIFQYNISITNALSPHFVDADSNILHIHVIPPIYSIYIIMSIVDCECSLNIGFHIL